jgi:hypothetical protein
MLSSSMSSIKVLIENGSFQARALTGALLDGVGKVLEKEGGDSTARQFSSAVS